MAEKLKVKELGPDQPDDLIYCEELFMKLFAVPQPHLKKISPAATGCSCVYVLIETSRASIHFHSYSDMTVHYELMVIRLRKSVGNE